MASLKHLRLMEFGYPGYEIKVEFLIMREYLQQLEIGISSISSSYIEREEKVNKGVDSHEFQHIYGVAEEGFPRLIRMPFFISTYTLLEISIKKLMNWAKTKEEKTLSFSDINGRSLMSKCNKYCQNVLLYDFYFTTKDLQIFNSINGIRNCIVHANGDFGSMDDNRRMKILQIVDDDPDLTATSGQLEVSQNYLVRSMEFTEAKVSSLMQYMENRYRPGE